MTVEENLRMGAYILRDSKKIAENLERLNPDGEYQARFMPGQRWEG